MMKKFSTLKQRIREYIDFKGISIREFYKQTGISDGTFSNESGLSEDNILKFFSAFPEVNPVWFIKGEGLISNYIEENYSVVEDDKEKYHKKQTDDELVIYLKKLVDRLEIDNARLQNENEILKGEKKPAEALK